MLRNYMLKRLKKDGYQVTFLMDTGEVMAAGPKLPFLQYEKFKTVTDLYRKVYG